MDNEASNPENQEGHKTSFWKLLEKYRVEVPIIQRDYAQGRVGKEFLRTKFLEDLKKALDNKVELVLDFVYGSQEGETIRPLDGQQRLTTLWLLHWYIALRAGELEGNCEVLKRFTYETRISSREFCENLCKPENFTSFKGEKIVDFIEKQTWFYSAWKQDPTIQSMLRMLSGTERGDDGIERVFEGVTYGTFWEKLTSNKEPAPVVFYYLPLENFGLSDDLYVKMNARGKPLTPFENFKADLIGYLSKRALGEDDKLSENERKEWIRLYETIPAKLDNDWTDIFWDKRSNKDKKDKKDDEQKIDEIYFAFLNRFFWNELFIATKTPRTEGSPRDYFLAGDLQGLDEKDAGEDKDPYHRCYRYLNTSESRGEYRSLDLYKFCKAGNDSMEISLKLFENLNKVLNNYLKYMDAPYEIPSTKWIENFRFIPKYDDSGNLIKILKPQRVIFFALCKYFMEEDESASPDYNALQDWMRVVCNLVSGRISNKPGDHLQIRNNNEARMVIEYIDDYLCTHDVYDTQKWKVDEHADPFSFKGKCYEEYIKAKKIFEDKKNNGKDQWENKIRTAEGYSFFNGTIRFLYQGEDGKEEDWGNFNKKWENAQIYFTEGTSFLRNQGATTLRLLIKQFEEHNFKEVLIWGGEGKKKREAEDNKNKMILGNGVAAWRSYLINPRLSAPVHKFLTINDKISDAIEGLKKQPCPEDGDEVKHALYLLTKTELLDRVIEVFAESGLRYEDDKYKQRHLVVRKFGSSEFTRGKQFVLLNTSKYDFLENRDVTKREESYEIEGTKLHFEFANICFHYGSYNFILYRDDNLIYLQPKDPKGWEGVCKEGTDTEYHFGTPIDDVAADWENDEDKVKEEKIKNFLSKLEELGDKARAAGHDEVYDPPSNS